MDATRGVSVHPSNAEQLGAWDGGEGAYWADHADRFDRAVTEHHRRLLDAAQVGAGERVLDVGCGTGQTTIDAASAATQGSALGVDLSSRMLEVARARAGAAGIANVAFEQADAQVHPFGAGTFDLVVSRTGAMFFGDPPAAFANLATSLRPGGRLVLVTWQDLVGNEWIRELSGALATGRDLPAPPPGAPGPFSLSAPDHVRSLLTTAGFGEVTLDGFEADMWFGEDADDAARFVLGLLGWMLEGLDERGRAAAVEALHATTAAHDRGDGVWYRSAAWIVHATRT
jgi:SAM-dependent methyltransferase